MLLDTLGVSLLGNILTVKGTRPGFLMPPHPLTNFVIQNLMVLIQEIIYLK